LHSDKLFKSISIDGFFFQCSLCNTPSPSADVFWNKCKKYLKPSSSSLHGLINPAGQVIKDPNEICNVAADYYEVFFRKSSVIRPYPYTDSPPFEFENADDTIPEVTIVELLNTVQTSRKRNHLMLMVLLVSFLNFLIRIIDLYSYLSSIFLLNQLFYL